MPILSPDQAHGQPPTGTPTGSPSDAATDAAAGADADDPRDTRTVRVDTRPAAETAAPRDRTGATARPALARRGCGCRRHRRRRCRLHAAPGLRHDIVE
jgi:hypothetical protein